MRLLPAVPGGTGRTRRRPGLPRKGALLPRAALLFLAAAACAPAAPAPAGPERADAPAGYVVLVSFDGFRHDYLDRGLTPVLDSLARAGVRADGLVPVMPTKTFPSHYSMATGMHPEAHGLVANVFRDAVLGTYSPADRRTVEDGAWYGGEPIWVAAHRQGVRTASMFWVGTEAAVLGVRPDRWHRFDAALPATARVDSVLAWLALPARERPRLVTLYFDFTDTAGSLAGPDSPQADSAIAEADRLVTRLVRGLRPLPHADRIALVVLSDHGMATVRGGVFLDEHDVPLDGVDALFHGPFATFHLAGDSGRIRALQAALARVPRTRSYLRAELPAEWRWSHPRLGDLVLVADPGWMIAPRRGRLPAGAHGWPPSMPEMHAPFVASGAGVAAGRRLPALPAVHVHAFVAALLGIEPGAGSESVGPLRDALAR